MTLPCVNMTRLGFYLCTTYFLARTAKSTIEFNTKEDHGD